MEYLVKASKAQLSKKKKKTEKRTIKIKLVFKSNFKDLISYN